MKKTIGQLGFVVVLLLMAYVPANAQISYGGMPESFKQGLKGTIDVVEFQEPNLSAVKSDDEYRDANGELYRYGVSVKAGLNMENAGSWATLANGDQIWRLKIVANGALGIGIQYNDLWLPEGSSLFVYNEDKSQVLGAFTHLNNPTSGVFANELIYGDNVTLEYYQPANLSAKAIISISEFAYAYRSVYGPTRAIRTYGSSQSCEVDANCSEGDDWRDQQRGVARISVKSGTDYGWCSGSLVNNVEGNCMPYFLTADHCADGASFEDVLAWVFYFNYERENCNDNTESEPVPLTITGAKRCSRGGWTGSDFYLVRFNTYVPIEYDVFFNGWRTANTTSTGGVGIHHPAGDVKKISAYTVSLINSGGTHWAVRWATTTNGFGVTEGGSSGSPIFNNNKQIVGTLTGGLSACTTGGAGTGTGPNQYDSYGKFSYSWAYNGNTAEYRLKDWLDPQGTSPDTINGKNQNCASYPLVADFYVEETSVEIGTYLKFNNLTLKNPALGTTYSWEFQGVAQSATTAITNPGRTFNQAGTFPVTLTASNSEMSDSKTIYITVNPNGVEEVENAAFNLYPNPARDIVTIQLNENLLAGTQIGVYNMLGEEIMASIATNSNEVKFSLKGFEPGMYFVRVASSNGTYTQKLTLTK